MPEQLTVKCPSCRSDIRAIGESRPVDSLRQHQYERHAIEMAPERFGRTSPPNYGTPMATTPDRSAGFKTA